MENTATDDITVESTQNGQVVELPPDPPVEPVAQGDGHAGDEDAAQADPASEAGKTLNAKKGSLQARIDAQTAKQRQAERERDQERDRASRLEGELQALKQPKQTQSESPRYTRPKPTEDEIGTKYETYGAYVEDLTDWKVEQRDVQQAERSQQSAIQQRHEQHAQSFSTRIAEAEKTDPDFWSKMHPDVVNLRPSGSIDPREMRAARDAARQGDPRARGYLATIAIADVIFTSEHTTDLMLHFSEHPKEFQRLSTLPPNELFREMGRLEAQYVRPAAASSGPAAKPLPVSSAAPPIKPVGSTASAGADLDPLTDDLDMDTHIRVMNAKERKAGRR